jgi:hypothetical protein
VSTERFDRDYRSLLHPEELRSTLLLVSLFVLAYESFKDGAIDHVRMLFMRGIDQSGWLFDEESYKTRILSRKRSPFRASLDWYREMGALDDADLASIEGLANTRNRLVHELWKHLGTPSLSPDLEAFSELIRVYRKLEVWRVVNLELIDNDEFEGQEINEDEIIPGPIMMMRMLVEVALGKDAEAWAHYNEIVKRDEGRYPRDETQ